MRWLELTVRTHPEAVEAVSELLSRHTPGGVAVEEPFELVDEGQEYRVLTGEPVQIHAYLPIDGKEEELRQHIAEGLWHLASLGDHFVGELQVRTVNEEDWANAWKDYFHVTHIGRRLVIRPSWREYTPAPGEIVLELDPGMAFGTGLHPTTRMCLEAVEQRTQAGMRVLDVGTGSGILALAAAKLGASSVYCVDNSNVAVESARANVANNNLAAKVTVAPGELGAERMAARYDMVLVNIFAHVIGAMAPQLAQVLVPGGLLIASGIIEARLQEALSPLQTAGLQLIDQANIDDWLVLIMRRPEEV